MTLQGSGPARKPLSAARRLRLDKNRVLPKGHTKPASLLRAFSAGATHDAATVIRESGVVPYIEERLRSHPGPPSAMDSEKILVPALLNMDDAGNYWRTGLAKAMACLDVQYAHDSGLINAKGWNHPSFRVITDQTKRFERAFEDGGWIAKDGTRCDLRWLAHGLITASIPAKARKNIGAIAIDSTGCPTWAVPRLFTPEKDLRRAHQLAAAKLLEQDPLVQHHKAAAKNPHSAEPDLPKPTEPSNKIGEMGPDGRFNRGLDYQARPGHLSATASRKETLFFGFDFHLGAAVPKATWRGDPYNIKIGSEIDAYITHLAARPALSDYGPGGLEVIEESLKVAPGIEQVLGDRGYSRMKDTVVHPTHKLKLDFVMDYDKYKKRKPNNLYIGKHAEPATQHCGTILHKFTPEKWKVPPPDMADAELEQWFAERFNTWAWRIHTRLDCGGLQMLCPQCLGRFTSNAKTHKKQSAAAKRSARSKRTTKSTPHVKALEDAQWCCSGLGTAAHADVGDVQSVPYGTPAQRKSYLRRLRVETRIAVLKLPNSLEKGWVRTFGLVPHTIAGILAVVAHNMELTREARMRHREQADERHRKKLAATGGTEDGDPGPTNADAATESDTADDGEDTTAPRAPP